MKPSSFIVLFLLLTGSAFSQTDKPSVTVTLQPEENGAAVYQVVSANSSKHEKTAQIALLLAIKNNESKQVKLTRIRIRYKLGEVYKDGLDTTFATPISLAANASTFWHQERWSTCLKKNAAGDCVDYLDNVIYVAKSNPSSLTIKLYFEGYNTPVEVTRNLKPHKSPTPTGDYLFPAKAKDLRVNEYWSTASTHGTSAYGSQLFAYDMGCTGWNNEAGWQRYIDNNIKTSKASNFRVYGKPLYAMADGIVCSFHDGEEENPDPPNIDSTNFAKGKTTWGGGNNISILGRDELFSYAHLRKNTIPAALKKVGAKVKAGDYLGSVGNTGNSSEPHVHIDILQIRSLAICTTGSSGNHPDKVALRPFHFRNSWVISNDNYEKPDPKDDWVELKGTSVPATGSMIWPNGKPCYFPPERTEIAIHGIAYDDYQNEFNKITGCGYHPIFVDGYQVNGKTYFNAIFRPNREGLTVYAKTKLTDSEYDDEIRKNSASSRPMRLIHVESYEYNGSRRYAFIMVNTPGPATVAYHKRTYAEHKVILDDLEKKGYVPTNVSVTNILENKLYAALFEKKAVGAWLLKSNLTHKEYQDLFEEQGGKNAEQVYINAYKDGGQTKFSVIWYEKGNTGVVAVRKTDGTGYQDHYNKNTGVGLLTRCVTGYEEGNKAHFAAHWSQ